MKLLILGFLAVVMLAAAGRSDCFWQWRAEARDQVREAREQVREAREQARDLRHQHRDQMRAYRDELRQERDRLRREIRENMRWGYTY